MEAVGYVGRGGNSYGEYEMTTERGQALAVRVPVCPEPDEDEDEVSAEVFGMETLVSARSSFRGARALTVGYR